MSQEIKQTKCCPNCGAQLESRAVMVDGNVMKLGEDYYSKKE